MSEQKSRFQRVAEKVIRIGFLVAVWSLCIIYIIKTHDFCIIPWGGLMTFLWLIGNMFMDMAESS